MSRVVSIAAIVLCSMSVGFANIANPDLPKKSLDTSLSISIDSRAKEAKLIIPRSQLRQLRAELDRIEGGEENTASAGNFGRTQTLVSASLLSLAFIFGGMWFLRTSPKNSKSVAAVAVLFAFGSVANLVYGNAGPPPEARSITGKMFSDSVHMYKQGSGKIKLEVSDQVDHPELIVPDTPKKADDE